MKSPRAEPLEDAALEAEVQALLAQPMPGAIHLALTRTPSQVEVVAGERGHRVFAWSEGATGRVLAGMGVRSVRRVWIAGQAVNLGYLGQLRVVGKVGVRRWRSAWNELLASRAADEWPFDLTTIASDNQRARRLLERGLPGFPRYEPLGEIVTLVFNTASSASAAGLGWRAVTPQASDLPTLVARLAEMRETNWLAPRWSLADFEPGGCRGLRLEDFLVLPGAEGAGGARGTGDGAAGLAGQRPRALAAIWDQRAFKQVRILGYAPALRWLRPLHNGLASWLGQPRLPRPPATLALAYLAFFTADDPTSARLLLDAACARARQRGIEHLALAWPASHPWLPELGRARSARAYRSCLYAVGADPKISDLEPWRRGILHLEGAIL